MAYTVSGAVENVYASLVVLLGYTHTFTRTNQWRNHARYEVGNGLVCGFRQEAERDGELDFVLYFGTNVGRPVRTLFQSLFESFLARRNLTVRRYEPVVCSKGHPLNRAVVREQMSGGADFAFCTECGEKIVLPESRPADPTDASEQATEVEAQRRAADQRSRFEQVLFRLKTYVTEQKIAAPECFISYAWGNPEHERWVEHSLATDLHKAGITVVLDRWENARIGASVPRFVERVGKMRPRDRRGDAALPEEIREQGADARLRRGRGRGPDRQADDRDRGDRRRLCCRSCWKGPKSRPFRTCFTAGSMPTSARAKRISTRLSI